MKLVMFEPAPGCNRLGLWFDKDIVDLALASNSYKKITRSEVHELPNDMMLFLEQGERSINAAKEVAQWARGLQVK